MFVTLYYTLQAISNAILTIVKTVWRIEEVVVNFIMSSLLWVLSIVCHPILLIPTMVITYSAIRKIWRRRRTTYDGYDATYMRNIRRTPRVGSYRSAGSYSGRSYDSYDSS